MSMLLTLLFTCLAFLGHGDFRLSVYGSRFLPPDTCLINARVSIALFSEICTNVYTVTLSDQSQNCIRPDTRLQIKGHKKSARPSSCVTFCTLTPKIRWYYHLQLYPATTTAIQSSVPKIMDTPRTYKIDMGNILRQHDNLKQTNKQTNKQTPWSVSASELYRPSDRRLPANCQLSWIKVPRGQRDGSLRPYSRFSRQEPLLFYQLAPQL
jgi:hypothetical protein